MFVDDLVVGKQTERNIGKALIKGQSCWGVLRGLESLTQLIYTTKENGYVVS